MTKTGVERKATCRALFSKLLYLAGLPSTCSKQSHIRNSLHRSCCCTNSCVSSLQSAGMPIVQAGRSQTCGLSNCSCCSVDCSRQSHSRTTSWRRFPLQRQDLCESLCSLMVRSRLCVGWLQSPEHCVRGGSDRQTASRRQKSSDQAGCRQDTVLHACHKPDGLQVGSARFALRIVEQKALLGCLTLSALPAPLKL